MTKTKTLKKLQKGRRQNKINIARGRAPALPPRTIVKTKVVKRKAPTKKMSMGEKIGMHLGGAAQKILKMATGFGDYNVNSNSLMSNDVPIVRNAPGGTIVRHREYIQDIYAATNFTINTLPLNPGQAKTFPWLSSIADSYEEYHFRGVIFEFKTMSADNVLSSSATTALGTVIMATTYNALQPNFTDKRTMENYEFANSSKPSRTFIHPIECKDSVDVSTHRYIRTGTTAPGDLRLYDLGTFQYAVQGCQANSGVIGELWVTYEIEFYKPKIVPSLTSGYDTITLTGVSSATPGGSAMIPNRQTVGGTFATSNAMYSFPLGCVGRFIVLLYGASSSAVTGGPSISITASTGLTLVPITGPANTSFIQAPEPGVMAARAMTEYVVQVAPIGNGAPSTFTIANNFAINSQVTFTVAAVDYSTLTSY